jgi:hypothetical protein
MLDSILELEKRQRTEPSSLLSGVRQMSQEQRPAQPWATQRYLAVKIACKIAPFACFPESEPFWAEYQALRTKLTQSMAKQASALLNSPHAEDRASALNLLSSLCNLDVAINLEDLSELQVSQQT